MKDTSTLHVVYFGTYRARYARNQIFIEGLRRNGVKVTECHQMLWESVEDRVQTARGGWMQPRFWWRILRTYWALILKFMRLGEFDVLVVGYPGHYDVFLARILAWLRRVPLVWDVLNSLFLIVSERGIGERSPITVSMIRKLESMACRLPDMMILDTQEFVDWFCQTHRLNPGRFRLVQIGADDRFFSPQPDSRLPQDEFRVIYYGTYIPNHGVETIVRAAMYLQDDPGIKIIMAGDGPDRELACQIAAQASLQNIEFYEWLDHDELIPKIANAHIVLGAFGTTRQLELTNNNKIYEGFAMQKAVISGDSPALPHALQNEVHLLLCRRGDPLDLANAIRRLKAESDLRARLASAGYALFVDSFNPTAIGARLLAHLHELV